MSYHDPLPLQFSCIFGTVNTLLDGGSSGTGLALLSLMLASLKRTVPVLCASYCKAIHQFHCEMGSTPPSHLIAPLTSRLLQAVGDRHNEACTGSRFFLLVSSRSDIRTEAYDLVPCPGIGVGGRRFEVPASHSQGPGTANAGDRDLFDFDLIGAIRPGRIGVCCWQLPARFVSLGNMDNFLSRFWGEAPRADRVAGDDPVVLMMMCQSRRSLGPGEWYWYWYRTGARSTCCSGRWRSGSSRCDLPPPVQPPTRPSTSLGSGWWLKVKASLAYFTHLVETPRPLRKLML